MNIQFGNLAVEKDGKTIYLTMEEAKELHRKLNSIFAFSFDMGSSGTSGLDQFGNFTVTETLIKNQDAK